MTPSCLIDGRRAFINDDTDPAGGAGGTIGNNDDVLSPGETIDLSINVTNTGTSTTVTGISGTLISSSAGVTVVNAVQTYANIAVGGTPIRLRHTESR